MILCSNEIHDPFECAPRYVETCISSSHPGTGCHFGARRWNCSECLPVCPRQKLVFVVSMADVVSEVSGGEYGGHKSRTSYGRISIINRDPLDHRYQTT